MQPQLCASRKVNRFANVSHTALWGYGLALQQGVSKFPQVFFFQNDFNSKEILKSSTTIITQWTITVYKRA